MRLWLMSCRVLKRGVEDAMLDTLVADAKEAGIQSIIGYYYPTAKNHMVEEFYGRMGFEKIASDEEKNTTWKLDVNTYESKNPKIEINR